MIVSYWNRQKLDPTFLHKMDNYVPLLTTDKNQTRAKVVTQLNLLL